MAGLCSACAHQLYRYWMFHAPANFYPALNGGDAAILFTFVFLLVVFTGAGALSADVALSRCTG